MAAEDLDTGAAVAAYLNDLNNPIPRDPAMAARVSVASSLGSNPDLEAELRQVAQRTGVPIDSVRAYPDEVKRTATIQGTDFDALARDFPTTAAYLADRENAKISHDDTDNLTLVERTTKAIGNGASALASAVPAAAGSIWRLAQAGAENVAPLVDPLVGTILPENPLRRFAAGAAGAAKSEEKAAGDLMPQSTGNVEAGVYSGLQSLGQMGIVLPLAIATGNPLFALGGMSALQGGQSYGQARDAGVSPVGALAFASSQAAIEYATEKLPVGRFLHDLQVGTPVGRFVMRQLAAEIPGEQLATLLQDANEWAVLNPGKSLSEFAAERPDAAVQTLVATVVAAGAASGVGKAAQVASDRFTGRQRAAEAALTDGQALADMDQAAAASKVRPRDAQSFQDFVAHAMQDGPVQDVYISAQNLAQSGVDLQALAAASPSVAQQLPEAIALGGDVRIPLDEFAARVAGTELSQSLLPHLKTDPAGMTQAEAQEYMANQGEQLRAEVEAVLAERTPDDAFKQSRERVQAQVLEQLNQAGRFTPDVNSAYANMTANFYAVQGARIGLSPEEMAARYPLNIQAEGFGQLNQAGQTETPEFKKWFGDSKVVDERGAPLTVYHGTAADFTAFDPALLGMATGDEGAREGYFFTNQPDEAAHYAREATFTADPASYEAGARGALYPVHLRMENPLYVDYAVSRQAEVIREAKAAGHDGIIDARGDYVVFSPEQIKSAIGNRGTFDANDPNIVHQGERGSFNVDTNTINLLKNADLSTFLHESGHFYLEVMADMASQPDAPASVRDDMQKLLDWFGVKDLAAWRAMDLEAQRPHHEQLARGFEAYLMEGKAPSNELQGVFQRFRAWLLATYRSLANLHVELSDEVRGVFDRMLASTEQIQETEAQQGYVPLFNDAEAAGMTPEEFNQYQSLGLEATQDAVEQLERRSIRDMRWLSNAKSRAVRELQKEAADRRKSVRAEVQAEVMAEPVNQARTFLKRGVDPVTNEPVEGPHKLKISALEDLYAGEGDRYALLDWSKLGYGQYGMLSEDGLNPDIVAERYGYKSGDELVRALLNEEPARTKIDRMTDQRMLERYGDLSDMQAISRAADEAVHNDARARFIATEINALQKALGQRSVLTRAARQFADATVARQRVRDVKPAQYMAAEQRAGRQAEAALKKADIQTAATEKKRQLINNYAARSAMKALQDVDKGVAYLKRLATSGTQSGMRGEGLAQLNNLLARFDLRTGQSLAQIDQAKQSLAEFVVSESDKLSAVVPDLPDFILNENYRKHYKDMTVEEFRGLVDSARQLALLGRREQQQYMALRAMTFADERDAILSRLREFHPGAFAPDGTPVERGPSFVPSLGRAVEKLGENFAGEFLNAETILNIMEGGQFGQVHESLFGRMDARANWKALKLEQIYKELKPLFKQWNAKERVLYGRKGIFIPAINDSLTRENALVVALLYGNAEGRERMTNYGWTDRQQQAIIDVLDARDLALARGIWNLFDNKLWPELKALNERTRGTSPPKVEPVPFTTRHGDMPGGYFRLKYDTDLDERAFRLDEGAAVKELLGGGMGMAAKTNQGSSTQRVQGVTMRPRLDLGVFAEAVNETVHDLAYREAVADTMRLLNDKAIQSSIKTIAGVAPYRALVTRVREVAAPPRNPTGFVEKTLSIARKNTVVVLMSGVKTALQNLIGIVPAFTRVNAGNLSLEVAKFYSPQMAERIRFTMNQSQYMRSRFNSFDRDLQDSIGKLTVRGKILPDTAAMLGLMGFVDRGVAIPVWNAAFKDGMGKFDNDTARAVDYADHIVRQTQGSGREVDLPRIMSGHGGYGQLKRVFTMFYSYFSGQLQQLVRAGAIAKQEAATRPGVAVARFTANVLALVIVPAILTEITGGGSGDDDDDELGKRFARAITMYGAGMFPIIRDLASFTWASFDSDMHNYGYKLSPVQSAGEGIVKGAKSVAKIFEGDAETYDVKNAIMGAGYLTGLPGKLISDVVTGFNAWLHGDAGPQAILLGAPRR
ncbi:hypothetical protein CAL26_10005 [Bordetella genomosp. 9]|uniref:Uncharacterized protein n=1 Tax=Bordetella genomosp. 9 TaxID=1416803 RepID=A0A261RFE9_9BORD|nr:hypothetical protein [Bordetella genomosp. 9]OZI23754.1 hypothetical protein CAL26_10005 [Bordetella genomosp. 9]